MARRYYRRRNYRKKYPYRRMTKLYKPLAGAAKYGDRFKIDGQYNIYPARFNEGTAQAANYKWRYTWRDPEGAAPQHSARIIPFITNQFTGTQKVQALGLVYEQCRIYGVSLKVMGAGAESDDALDMGDLCVAPSFGVGKTDDPSYATVLAFNHKAIVTQAHPYGKCYLSRKMLGSLEGYGTGDYTSFKFADLQNIQIFFHESGPVTEKSMKWKIFFTVYLECRISQV